jgi:mannose-6-phosphate isomerase-like protein (cupin superfamily)
MHMLGRVGAMGASSDKVRTNVTKVFVIQEGHATYTIGSTTLDATAGQIAIVPAGVPHKFINSGPGRLRQVDIHHSPRFITEWLED